jgi:preprotein translocase subunit SecY
MLETVRNAFKVKEVRNRILFTFLMLVVIRIGSQLPIPGVNSAYIQNFFATQTGDAFDFFDAFTGGSFLSMSILALNITPYITSSIIMQLLTIVIPKLEEFQKDGEEGRKKIVSITRFVTVGLALMEATAMAVAFGSQGLLIEYNFTNVFVAIVAMVAGSTFLMWVGERITENGIGNGISIVLVINILSRVPNDMSALYQKFIQGKSVAVGTVAALIIIAIILGMIVLVIYLSNGVRKIPVQYAQKIQGRKMVGGQSSNIPLKINTSGVIPIIFAASLFQVPVLITSFAGGSDGTWGEIVKGLSSSNWFDSNNMKYSWGLLLYVVLVIFFAYFYTSITFNPAEVANNMKKNGGFIPGIRPGKPTTEYLQSILHYIIFIGACGLTIVAVLPFFFNGVFGAQVSFGGTSLIIICSVIIDTVKQVESKMVVRNYKGFLNE